MQVVCTREGAQGSALHDQQGYRLLFSGEFFQRGKRHLWRTLTPHHEVLAKPPQEAGQEHVERNWVVINHEERGRNVSTPCRANYSLATRLRIDSDRVTSVEHDAQAPAGGTFWFRWNTLVGS